MSIIYYHLIITNSKRAYWNEVSVYIFHCFSPRKYFIQNISEYRLLIKMRYYLNRSKLNVILLLYLMI